MTTDDRLPDVLRRLQAARDALYAALGDMPSRGGTEGVSGGGTGEWGPTVSIALSLDRDTAWRDWEALNALDRLRRARGLSAKQQATFCDLIDLWAPPPRRKAKLEQGLRAAANDQLNVTTHNKCQSHLRIGALIDARTEGSRLCRWCEDWVRALNDPDGDWAMNVDMPTEQMVKASQDGRLLVRHLPPRRR